MFLIPGFRFLVDIGPNREGRVRFGDASNQRHAKESNPTTNSDIEMNAWCYTATQYEGCNFYLTYEL